MENIVGKGENAGYQHFLLFPQCFKKVSFPDTSKGVILWEWVKEREKFPPNIAQLTSVEKFCNLLHGQVSAAEPHSSVGSVADLRTGGHWFDPRLDQYSFRGLMVVIATGFIPLSLLSVVSTMVMWESSQWFGKNIVRSTGSKDLQESMESVAL